MFFRGGERLIIQGANLHKDYQRYNDIARGLYTSKVGEIAVENFFREGETRFTAPSKSIELSLWRVIDRNVNAIERGIDRSQFVIEKPNRERVSYVVVPRMNTDIHDTRPFEYTDEKDETFEDINDPRVIVIARSYKGVVAELAKDFIEKNEEGIRHGYKFLADDRTERYCYFSNPQFLRAVTEKAVQMFEPNVYQTYQDSQINRQDVNSGFYAFVDPISQILASQVENENTEYLGETCSKIIDTSGIELGSEVDASNFSGENTEYGLEDSLTKVQDNTNPETLGHNGLDLVKFQNVSNINQTPLNFQIEEASELVQ